MAIKRLKSVNTKALDVKMVQVVGKFFRNPISKKDRKDFKFFVRTDGEIFYIHPEFCTEFHWSYIVDKKLAKKDKDGIDIEVTGPSVEELFLNADIYVVAESLKHAIDISDNNIGFDADKIPSEDISHGDIKAKLIGNLIKIEGVEKTFTIDDLHRFIGFVEDFENSSLPVPVDLASICIDDKILSVLDLMKIIEKIK